MARNTAPSTWPKTIKHGNGSVKLYKVKNRGRDLFTLAFMGLNGKRALRQFADEAEAIREANAAARRIHEGDLKVLQLKDQDLHAYVAAIESLKKTGVRIDTAAEQFAQIHTMTGGRVLEAAEAFKRTHKDLKRRKVSEVVAELLDSIGGRSERHQETMRKLSNKFARTFPGLIDEITTGDIERWIEASYANERSRCGLRGAIVQLFRFARRRGYLPDETTQAEKVASYAKASTGEIGTFTPLEMAKLLHGCRADVLPYVIFGGFAGMRTEEIKRLAWEDIKSDRGHIELKKGKTKTRSRRLIPIVPVLADWLKLYEGASGLVLTLARPEKTAAQIIGQRAGVEWKHNALRHSFATYRMAAIQNETQVASEMGNTPRMIFGNYRELATKHEAEDWFSLTRERVEALAAADFPEDGSTPANVIPMGRKSA